MQMLGTGRCQPQMTHGIDARVGRAGSAASPPAAAPGRWPADSARCRSRPSRAPSRSSPAPAAASRGRRRRRSSASSSARRRRRSRSVVGVPKLGCVTILRTARCCPAACDRSALPVTTIRSAGRQRVRRRLVLDDAVRRRQEGVGRNHGGTAERPVGVVREARHDQRGHVRVRVRRSTSSHPRCAA